MYELKLREYKKTNIMKSYNDLDGNRQTKLDNDFNIKNPCKMKKKDFIDGIEEYNPDEHD